MQNSGPKLAKIKVLRHLNGCYHEVHIKSDAKMIQCVKSKIRTSNWVKHPRSQDRGGLITIG